jgi:hypothetical protein
MIYAGIGSRETPEKILKYMEWLGETQAVYGNTLRSGGAKGADEAFETGVDRVRGPKEIFGAKDATPEAIELAKAFHPNWGSCSPYARRLHGRNSMIILGGGLNDPVELVICWTKGGFPVGGTGQGIRIAEAYDIPIINLGNKKDLELCQELIPHYND